MCVENAEGGAEANAQYGYANDGNQDENARNVPTHHETVDMSKKKGQHPKPITNYQLPNDPVKAGRRWGQRHPQGANLGSNGILNFLSKLKQWLPPAHPKSLASQCMSGQPISTCHALTS